MPDDEYMYINFSPPHPNPRTSENTQRLGAAQRPPEVA